MIALDVCFPSRRYHATPWGHHVNEGLVEWPPSPWRILRALMATGFTKLGWSEVPPVGRLLIERLAQVLPIYRLPRGTLAHSRHYMPLGGLDQKTTLVLDTWVNVGRGVLHIDWPIDLQADARNMLGELARNLGYLGRAESWAEARLVDPSEGREGSLVEPAEPGRARTGHEEVRLLAPVLPEAYHRWRETEIAAVRSASAGEAVSSSTSGRKLSAKALEKERRVREEEVRRALAPYPPDLLSCLSVETAWRRAHGWSQPPGSRVVLYSRPAEVLSMISAPTRQRKFGEARVEAMLLALTNPSRNDHALPMITRALPQAEILHEALVSKVTKGSLSAPEVIGRDDAREPLKGHRHVHIAALDLDDDVHIDHLLVWAPDGLGGHAQAAVRAVRRTYAKGESDLSLAIVASGSLESLSRIRDERAAALARIVGSSTTWVSRTPFVAPRFVKSGGKNTLVGQVLAELESRGLPAARVEVLPTTSERQGPGFRHFVVARRKRSGPPAAIAWRLRLRFDRVVAGPLALEYASHFGLGSFATETLD